MLFSMVLDQVPNLFWLENNSQETSKEDVVRYVKKWNRFKVHHIIFSFTKKKEKINQFHDFFFIFQGTGCDFESKYERNRRPLD